MNNTIFRPYEISIWSLQDRFISVLKWSEDTFKGQLQDAQMVIKDDGTQTLDFKVPETYNINGNRIPNPLWKKIDEQPLEPNMHKLKVIFNKGTPEQKIYEFLVVVVTTVHELDEVSIQVQAEGLAFHELGKIGYKVSLSQEDFELDYKDWFENNKEEEPIMNINYWNDKIFRNSDGDWRTNWTYEVRMDHQGILNRDSTKVYEEAYVSDWNSDLTPKATETAKEKARPIDVKESNLYNITQTIAEKFGIFCQYEYEYDAAYQIIGRKVVYYNNYIKDAEGAIDLTYPYSSSSIQRTIDNMDLTTKLFVQSVEDDTNGTGLLTIMDVPANKSKEDYILNFDYLKMIGGIDEEQYDEIEDYESAMRKANDTLNLITEEEAGLSDRVIELEAQLTILDNSVTECDSKISDQQRAIDGLTGGTGIIEVEQKLLLIANGEDRGRGRYVDISFEGFVESSIELNYKPDEYSFTFNVIKDEYGNIIRLEQMHAFDANGKNEYTSGNITKEHIEDMTSVYLSGRYDPNLYHETIQKIWKQRRAHDDGLRTTIKNELDNINKKLQQLAEDKCTALKNKEKAIDNFTKMMGPALREGYWVPEDYKDYGKKYNQIISKIPQNNMAENNLDLKWDWSQYYDGESPILYECSTAGKIDQYIIIRLDNFIQYDANEQVTNTQLLKNLTSQNIGLFYYTYDTYKKCKELYGKVSDKNSWAQNELQKYLNESPQFAQGELGWIVTRQDANSNYGNPIPVFIVTGLKTLAWDNVNFIINNDTTNLEGWNAHKKKFRPFIGYYDTVQGNTQIQSVIGGLSSQSNNFIFVKDGSYIGPWDLGQNENIEAAIKDCNVQRAYPRLIFKSLKFKNNENDLMIKIDGELLKDIEDYYTFQYSEDETVSINNSSIKTVTGYSTTIKPQKIFSNIKYIVKNGGYTFNSPISVSFALSNADTYIYLDGLQVAKENSQPKVSYEVQINLLGAKFMHEAYNYLDHIANINDVELKLNNTHGYISTLNLNLDKPWEDTIEVKNYKNKFEDLFSTIVAQTEAMKKSEAGIAYAVNAFASDGIIDKDILQDSMLKADLNYYFNAGKLSITESEGIWGTSDEGVVAFRGGGIFTATEKDNSGNWIWNTGIIPSGINADLITSGQLNTNRIKIFAGNELRFQMNGEGIFAYKPFMDSFNISDPKNNGVITTSTPHNHNERKSDGTFKDYFVTTDKYDENQYVLFNSQGLFLTAKPGAYYLECGADDKTGINQTDPKVDLYKLYYPYENIVNQISEDDIIKRVEISWDGLILRDWSNTKVFYADPDTGNLNLTGNIIAKGGSLGGWTITDNYLSGDQIHLVGKGYGQQNDYVQAGIYLTKKEKLFEEIIIDNRSYYGPYTNGDNVEGGANNDPNNYYLTIRQGEITNIQKVNGNLYYNETGETSQQHPYDGKMYMLVNRVIKSVVPKYTLVSTTMSFSPSYEIVTNENEGQDASSNNTTTNYIMSTDANSTINQIYIYTNGDRKEENLAKKDGVPIIYDGINTYNISDTDHWYGQLAQAYPNDYEKYIIIYYGGEYQEVPFNDGTIFPLRSPIQTDTTFSVNASGEAKILKGTLANFSIAQNGLVGGTLSGGKIEPDNVIRIENNQTHTFGELFYDLSVGSDGNLVLTRVNGTTVNFNIAAMQAYKNAFAAASELKLSLTYDEINNKVTAVASNGSGANIQKEICFNQEDGSVSGITPTDNDGSGSNSCQGCQSICSDGCAGRCGNTCKEKCKESCGTSCEKKCSQGCSQTCTGDCGNNCVGTCTGGCYQTCTQQCMSDCTNTCKNTCDNTCNDTCDGGCTNTAKGTCGYSCAMNTH